MAGGFDPFGGRAAWPAGLVATEWVKQAQAVAALEDGRALAVALSRLEALYKKVDADELRPRRGHTFASLDDLDQAEKRAKSAYRSAVVPLIAQCLEVRKQAVAVARQAQSQPGIPRPALVCTAEVARLAEQVADAYKDLEAVFRPFDDARKALLKADDQVRKLLQPHMQALGKGLEQCLKNPSRELWDKACKGPCKAVHTAVKNTPRLKDEFWPVWKVHDGDAFSHALQMAEKSAKDDKARQKLDEVIVRMCKELRGELTRLDKSLG